MTRSLETAYGRWILRLRLFFMAPLLVLLIAAPPLSTGDELAEEQSEEEEKERHEGPKGFLASMFPDARHIHRIKTAKGWGCTEMFREFSRHLKQENKEKGEPSPYSAFEAHNHKFWRPKRKGKRAA